MLMPPLYFVGRTTVSRPTVSESPQYSIMLHLVCLLTCFFWILIHSFSWNSSVEVYPRPDGTVYICGIGGSDYISTDQLKQGAFLEDCQANEARVEAAKNSFQQMSSVYRTDGELEKTQACMRPCPVSFCCIQSHGEMLPLMSMKSI
jgi:hypothetical protein